MLWLFARAYAVCPDTVPVGHVAETAEAALAAWGEGRDEAFADAADELAITLPCFAPLQPGPAAAVHRALGLAAFSAGDTAAASGHFVAAHRADPAWSPPDTLFPPDTALRDLWDAAVAVGGEPERAPPPKGLSVLVDGDPGAVRWPDAPALVQLLEPTGAVDSRLLAAGAPLPPYPHRTPVRSRWVVAAAAAAATSGALYAGAWSSRAAFARSPDLAAAEAARTRTDGLLVGAAGAVVLGGAFGAAALAAGDR